MRKFILFIIALLIFGLIGIGINYAIVMNNVKTFEGLILDKDGDYDFTNEVITTYEEYQSVLEKYNGMGKLVEEDFVDHDYLVDFVPYVKDMTINNIEIELEEEDVNVIYEIDTDVSNSDKLLVNFIPIDKGTVLEFNQVNHTYN